MSDAEDLNRLAIKAQLLTREGQVLQNQIDIMQTTITDLNATIDTLKNLKQAKENGILPIGSGAYITCKEIDLEQALVSVGSGFIVRKNVKDAVDMLESRRKSAGESLETAQKALLGVSQSLQELNARASMISTRMEDVRSTEE